LLDLHARITAAASSGERRAAVEEAWLILHSAIARFARVQGGHLGSATREDIEDLASEKALELTRRLESGTWDPSGHGASEIAGFLSVAARNGLVDLLRRKGRFVELTEGVEPDGAHRPPWVAPRPEADVESRAFTGDLCDCVGRLKQRDRTVWFFRVLYELPSREIAGHPEIRLKPAHVDVILQRCRSALRECMTRKGHDVTEVPRGSFLRLWEAFRMPENEGQR